MLQGKTLWLACSFILVYHQKRLWLIKYCYRLIKLNYTHQNLRYSRKYEWNFTKDYYKYLGMCLFTVFFWLLCAFYWDLWIIPPRLICQIDVRGTLWWWWDFFNIMRHLFWCYHGLSNAKWSTFRAIHIGPGKLFLGSLTQSEWVNKNNVTLEPMFSRKMSGAPECFHFMIMWAITLTATQYFNALSTCEKSFFLETASAALI